MRIKKIRKRAIYLGVVQWLTYPLRLSTVIFQKLKEIKKKKIIDEGKKCDSSLNKFTKVSYIFDLKVKEGFFHK